MGVAALASFFATRTGGATIFEGSAGAGRSKRTLRVVKARCTSPWGWAWGHTRKASDNDCKTPRCPKKTASAKAQGQVMMSTDMAMMMA